MAVSGHQAHETTEEGRTVAAKKGGWHFAAPLSSAELERAGPVKTEWLWRGYLAPGSVTLLTSLWKSGKSTLIAVLLAQMKAGGNLAGLALGAGRAVVISEEPASLWALRNRMLRFGPHLSWYCQPFSGQPRMEDWQLLLDQIGRMHEQQEIDLLVIDSLAKLAPLRRENDAGEMLKALQPLERLAQAGMSVLILHHPRKGGYRPGQAARGSGALLAFVDIFIEMERVSRRNLKDRRRRAPCASTDRTQFAACRRRRSDAPLPGLRLRRPGGGRAAGCATRRGAGAFGRAGVRTRLARHEVDPGACGRPADVAADRAALAGGVPQASQDDDEPLARPAVAAAANPPRRPRHEERSVHLSAAGDGNQMAG